MKWIKKATLFVIFILIITTIFCYIFQDKLVFQASSLSRDYHFELNQPYEEYFITTPDTNTLNALWFKPTQQVKGLVIYFHGNADNLQRWGQYAIDITQLGYELLMIEYRGYGKSSGTPDEAALYSDASFIYQWAKENSSHDKIILYGRSLGSAVATHLAAEVQPDLLILETPFAELIEASFLRFLFAVAPLHSKFATKEFVDKVKCKIIIFHGTNDWVVSLKSAERLKPLLKKDDEFIIVPDGGHYNLTDYELYHRKLAEVLQ